jgi:hypothetical protein
MRMALLFLMSCEAVWALQADINHDGRVDLADLTILRQEYGQMSRNYAEFDGSPGIHIGIPNDNALSVGTGDFSICFWIKGEVDDYLIYKFDEVAPNPGYIVFGSGNTIRLQTFNGILDTQASASFTPSSLWQFICITRMGIIVEIFVDAVKLAVSGDSLADNLDNSEPMKIGRGTILNSFDDVRLYKKVLSAVEVAAIYNDGFGTLVSDDNFPIGTDGYYMNFDDSFSGAIVYGRKVVSGVGSIWNGTITGGVTQVSGGVPFHGITLEDDFKSYTKYINQSGRQIQFRMRNAGGNLQVRGYKPLTPKMTDNR